MRVTPLGKLILMMILYDAGKDFGGFGTIKTAQTTIFFMRLRFVCTVQCIGKHDNVKDRVIVCIIHLGHSGLRVFFGACTSRDELRSIASLNGAIRSFSVHTHHTHTHTHTHTLRRHWICTFWPTATASPTSKTESSPTCQRSSLLRTSSSFTPMPRPALPPSSRKSAKSSWTSTLERSSQARLSSDYRKKTSRN